MWLGIAALSKMQRDVPWYYSNVDACVECVSKFAGDMNSVFSVFASTVLCV